MNGIIMVPALPRDAMVPPLPRDARDNGGGVMAQPRRANSAEPSAPWERGGAGILSIATALVLLVSAFAPAAHAQTASAGIGYALTEYAEQGASLRFSGGGIAAHGSVGWNRFSLHVSAARLALDPKGDASAAESFDVMQTDVRLRARVGRSVSVEAGFLHRHVTPLHAAQSVSALRLGALLSMPLAPGTDLEARLGYVGAGKFSGGGSAPFGAHVGLGVSYAPRWERVRLTGDLDFVRLDRRTNTAGGEQPAPIQSTTARVGIAVVY